MNIYTLHKQGHFRPPTEDEYDDDYSSVDEDYEECVDPAFLRKQKHNMLALETVVEEKTNYTRSFSSRTSSTTQTGSIGEKTEPIHNNSNHQNRSSRSLKQAKERQSSTKTTATTSTATSTFHETNNSERHHQESQHAQHRSSHHSHNEKKTSAPGSTKARSVAKTPKKKPSSMKRLNTSLIEIQAKDQFMVFEDDTDDISHLTTPADIRTSPLEDEHLVIHHDQWALEDDAISTISLPKALRKKERKSNNNSSMSSNSKGSSHGSTNKSGKTSTSSSSTRQKEHPMKRRNSSPRMNSAPSTIKRLSKSARELMREEQLAAAKGELLIENREVRPPTFARQSSTDLHRKVRSTSADRHQEQAVAAARPPTSARQDSTDLPRNQHYQTVTDPVAVRPPTFARQSSTDLPLNSHQGVVVPPTFARQNSTDLPKNSGHKSVDGSKSSNLARSNSNRSNGLASHKTEVRRGGRKPQQVAAAAAHQQQQQHHPNAHQQQHHPHQYPQHQRTHPTPIRDSRAAHGQSLFRSGSNHSFSEAEPKAYTISEKRGNRPPVDPKHPSQPLSKPHRVDLVETSNIPRENPLPPVPPLPPVSGHSSDSRDDSNRSVLFTPGDGNYSGNIFFEDDDEDTELKSTISSRKGKSSVGDLDRTNPTSLSGGDHTDYTDDGDPIKILETSSEKVPKSKKWWKPPSFLLAQRKKKLPDGRAAKMKQAAAGISQEHLLAGGSSYSW